MTQMEDKLFEIVKQQLVSYAPYNAVFLYFSLTAI